MTKTDKLLPHERKVVLSADDLDAMLEAFNHLAQATRRLAARQLDPTIIDLTNMVDGIAEHMRAAHDLPEVQ